MFKNIIVPVDFTEKNLRAVEIACQMAKPTQGKVVLLHVIETIKYVSFEEIEDFYSKLEKKAEEKLDQLVGDFSEKEFNMSKKIIFGSRAPEIVQYAQDNNADLIIMNSHRVEPGEKGAGFASISYKVGVFSTCPVLLVK